MAERARARTLIEQLGIRPPNHVTRAKALQGLRKRELVVEYELLPSGLAIFVADSNSISVQRVKIKRDQLDEIVGNLRRAILRHAPIEEVREHAARAWRYLIDPVADRVIGAERLVIVPDRFLHDVPYAALYDVVRKRYLIETHVISVSPSLSLLLREKNPMTSGSVVILGPATSEGDELPAAESEVRRIAGMYPSATLLSGHDVTAQSFLAAAKYATMLHYAGHARPGSDVAGVIPFGTDAYRGALTAQEIARFRFMRHPLVVLAACGTLRGNADRIEGMPSLARAFLAAGASKVVGTLWDIPDDASERFFVLYHHQPRLQHDAAAALASTQRLFVQRRNSRSHPFFWAAAELFGAQ